MSQQNVEDIYRLAPVQQGMLFHTLAAPGSGVYFEQFSLRYGEGFDPEAFLRAWQRTVDRHPVLRTSFLWDDLEQPVQVVHARVEVPVERRDWRALDAPAFEIDRRLAAYAAEDRRRGFDLQRPPLLRLALIRTGDEDYRVVWSYHHLVLDGWSAGLVMREVFAHYRAESGGGPARLEPRRPYKEYVKWLLAQDLDAAQAYWRGALAGFTAPTPLGLDGPPAGTGAAGVAAAGAAAGEAGAGKGAAGDAGPGTPDGSGYDLRLLRLDEPATAALKSFAQGARLTLGSVVTGAWALLLAAYSGEQDVVFGATVSGRPPSLPGVETMIGCFINTLPVRVRVTPERQLVPWLRELQSALAAMRRHEHTPLGRVQTWSAVPRPLPLFESIVVFESFTDDAAFAMSHSGVFQRTNYPLTLVASPGAELALRAGYETSRLSGAAVERLLGHLAMLLRAMADGGGPRRLDELPALTAAERQQLLLEWNDTEVAAFVEPDLSLHGLFQAQAARTPRAVALVCGEERLSYGELAERAGRLARRLRRLGVGPEVPVGVCLERSVELVVALLAVLEAGGAYLPLDPSYPSERLALMLADAWRGSVPRVLLVAPRLLDRLGTLPAEAQVVALDNSSPAPAEAEGSAAAAAAAADGAGTSEPGGEVPAAAVGPETPAYVIYTSGSTGRPKGVVNTHRGIVNRLLWMQHAYRLTAEDRVLQKTPFSFDVSVWELFWPLLAGARLVMAPPGAHQDPAWLARLIAEHGITTLHFVPPMLQAFVAEPGAAACGSLRRVMASGEALPAELVRRFHDRFAAAGVELHNLYGPTEAAVDVTSWPCARPEPGATAPIGRPVANTSIHLLDGGLRPAPIGVPGELYIGGVQLARGYLGRPELTAERFVPDPFAGQAGARLYCTGDLARRREGGAVEFLGRIDHQVKVRGFRVELGEIEAALATHPAVREAVVTVRGDLAEDRRLVAYLVARGEGLPAPEELRGFLHQRLPEFMVPAAFVALERLPLLANGKVDRRALPAPDAARPELQQAYAAPETAVEQELAAIWSRVLGVAPIGLDDDFFALGGDSILSIRISALARERGLTVLLPQLFSHRTVRQLARAVAPAAAAAPSGIAAAPVAGAGAAAVGSAATGAAVAPAAPEEVLARLDQLSENEVDALLGELMAAKEAVP
jgi:amino acid adenylation domain-containing protein